MTTYTLTEKQDAVLVPRFRYFNELVGGDMIEEDFDSLVDLVCNTGDDVVKGGFGTMTNLECARDVMEQNTNVRILGICKWALYVPTCFNILI